MPGQKISEKDIKTDIGIVRTPVREAILRLKQEGLIKHHTKVWYLHFFN